MAARGGRGGGRGGRGGGASGRGGGLFATGSQLMGGLSYNDVVESSKAAMEAKLYPVRHRVPARLSCCRTVLTALSQL